MWTIVRSIKRINDQRYFQAFSFYFSKSLFVVFFVELVCAEDQVIRCIQKERQALLHLKAGLNDTYGMLTSWTTADCCQWKGICCSNLTGHILMLDLHGPFMESEFDYGYLSGKIHSSLMELRQLQYLNLSHNYFGGSHIPNFINSLSNLRYLDLSYSNFGGKVPCEFGALSHLKYLDLKENYLGGSIPSQLGNLSNLQFLDLRGNSFEGTIPSQLGKLPNLQELYLSGSLGSLKIKDENHDGGQWLSNLTSLTHLYLDSIHDLNSSCTLPQMIAKLPKLRELRLIDCSLSDDFLLLKTSSHFKFSTTSLSVLDLYGNSFSSSMIFQLVSNFSSNLVELDLSYNLLEAPPSNDFGRVMNSLERLNLYDNRLKGQVMKSFMNICTLHSLDMRENNLTEDLPSIVYNLYGGCVRYSLQELILSFNQITGSLPDLSTFSSLKILDLDENKLSGKTPEGVRLPSQLKFLSIESNSLEGGIPKSFGNACALQGLNLRNNSLSEELPVLIHHLSGCARYSLQVLYLGMNQIKGTLPVLSLLSSLKSLDLTGNMLSGRVSDANFANMSMLMALALSDNSLALTFNENWVLPFQLQYIQLGSCKLGPTFPKWLQTQNRVQTLDISNAGISGIVPKWFWDKLASQWSSKWMSIDISHNSLEGIIPNFPLEKSYASLSLASNQFEGTIPPFLRSFLYVDVSNNKFSESLSFLCANNSTVETSYHLDLSKNQLLGQIPDCWYNFKSLAYLNLSHNNFLGKIPTSMGSLLELRVLLLRNNSLTEEIPSSLMSCTELVMLDAGENRLSGPIPSWIGSQLQKLQVLSLGRNHFFGSLPLQLCNLNKIQVLDLSLNNLSGPIPKCFKKFTFMAQQTPSRDYSDHRYIVNTSSGSTIRSYDLNAFLMWKGAEQMFLNGQLFLLKSIDLSSNHFSEEIPAEIEDLFGLVSLNLSRNNLTGQIPSNIGKLASLDFLDLSRNQLLGPIPSSLAQIDRLTMLDVSNNHLSGQIPTSTQLQSFDASNYEDNLDLCGPPLQKLCIKGEPALEEPIFNYDKDEDLFITRGFYMSLVFGFVIGFWGIFGSIIIKRSWRHAYFRFLNNLTDNVYVLVTVNFGKCKRCLTN